MRLRVKRRILTIRLLEKVMANPARAKALGIMTGNGAPAPGTQRPSSESKQ